MTLEEARDFVKAGAASRGVRCPCCNRFCKVYKRALNVAMARALIWLNRNSTPDGDFIHLPTNAPTWIVAGLAYPKLKTWGMVDHAANEDTKKKHSGKWRITPRGVNFVRNEALAMKYIVLYQNVFQGFEGPMVSIVQALGTEFDYQELMTGQSSLFDDE